ncbi:MAG: OmpA family protein [bacterium]
MPPPKNGSLGRGLGDLLGGVPENLGVAGASPRPAKTDTAMPSAPAPVTEVRRDVVMVEKPWWTAGRIGMAVVAGVVLFLVGGGVSGWLVTHRLGRAQNTVINDLRPVPPEPVPAVIVPPVEVKSLAIDTTDLQALATLGVNILEEHKGVVELQFDNPLFKSRVTLDPGQSKCLDQLGGVLAKHADDWTVLVVGHTDSIPMRSNGPFKDNKELGLGRAVEVIRYLGRHAVIPASMLVAATAGEVNPPFPGDTPEAVRKNRTVTIRISPAK